jgi:hypothetical protein
VRKHTCHTAFFLKCLHNVRPFSGPERLKCLPNRPHNLKCLLKMPITIHSPLIFFLYNVVCNEYGKYCSSTTLLVHWLMLSRCLFIGFSFSCCYCSCFPVDLVVVCTFGILQLWLELCFRCSPLTSGFRCHVYLPIRCLLFFISSL